MLRFKSMKQLNFSNDYILENERVLLRPLRPEDFENLKEFAINEPDLWEYSLLPADGLENMKIYLDAAFADKKKETAYPFIVFDKKTNRFVGSTRFYDYQKNTIRFNSDIHGMEKRPKEQALIKIASFCC